MEISLDSEEIEILTLYFGLNDSPPSTLAKIAKGKNVSRERIRQIKGKILEKLQKEKYKIAEKFPFVFNEYVSINTTKDKNDCI